MCGRIHELKVWTGYFKAIVDGEKTFEVRKNDRDFRTGDQLHLKEFEPNSKTYTGRECVKTVTYMMMGPAFGVEPGHCVMAIS